jgi:hypothetical protein
MGSQCCKPKQENSIYLNFNKIDYVAINAIKIPEDIEETQNIPFIIPRNPTKRVIFILNLSLRKLLLCLNSKLLVMMLYYLDST